MGYTQVFLPKKSKKQATKKTKSFIICIAFLFMLTSCEDVIKGVVKETKDAVGDIANGKQVFIPTIPPVAIQVSENTEHTTATATVLSWAPGNLDVKKHFSNEGVLTQKQINYKVYVVEKGQKTRTAEEVKTDAVFVKEVLAGLTEVYIAGLNKEIFYEIVVEAINSIDITKSSMSEVAVFTTNTIEILIPSGSVYVHQSIRDPILLDESVVARVTGLSTDKEYTYSLGNARGSVIAIGGTVEITKAGLKDTDAADGAELRLSGDNLDILVTYYKPLQIYTWQDLQAMRLNLEGNYSLMKDIILPNLNTDGLPSKGFVPIGMDLVSGNNDYDGIAFSGTFDGNNKSISNLQINDPNLDSAGLFGGIDNIDSVSVIDGVSVLSDASANKVVVKDLNIINPVISGRTMVGALAGVLIDGTVNNISISSNDAFVGKVTGFLQVGSLVGVLAYRGVIISSESKQIEVYARVDAGIDYSGSHVGGIVGYNVGHVVNVYASGKVEGDFHVGGLVGHNYGVIRGYADSEVKGREIVGGLTGWSSFLTSGYASGEVEGDTKVGGLTGSNGGQTNGYATARVKGNSYVGGLVGFNEAGRIVGYARGQVIRKETSTDLNFGLLVGRERETARSYGYHSTSESSFKNINAEEVTGSNGIAMTMTAATPQEDFTDDYEYEIRFPAQRKFGKWVWVEDGLWPAIYIGDIKPVAEQPIRPVYSMATAPPIASMTESTRTINTLTMSWTAGDLNENHLSSRGEVLTQAEISYKVYAVEQRIGIYRSAQQIKLDASSFVEVAVGEPLETTLNLRLDTSYEIMMEAINTTDITKTSLGNIILLF